MFISVDTRLADYEYVIELNNLGVELMEAKAYKSATHALREAIQMMKTVVQPNPESQFSYTNEIPKVNERALFEARLRVWEARSSPASSRIAPDAMYAMGTPIRIEASEMLTTDGNNPDMASAVLLYNFGLVNRWASSECVDPFGKLREGALRLFKMSYSILTDRQRLSSADPEDMSETRIFLLLNVLNVLSQIEAELGKLGDASAHIEELVRLGRLAMFKTNCDSFLQPCAAAAA
jgi:hypothetical protein